MLWISQAAALAGIFVEGVHHQRAHDCDLWYNPAWANASFREDADEKETICEAYFEGFGASPCRHQVHLLELKRHLGLSPYSAAMHGTRVNLSRFKQRENVISQKASGTVVLFDMDEGTYFSLNEVGAKVWDLCSSEQSLPELVAAVWEEYEAPLPIIESDVHELLGEMLQRKLITEAIS